MKKQALALLALPLAVIAGKVALDKLSGQPAPATHPASPSPAPTAHDQAPLGGAVSAELLEILVCPEDKGPLELIADGKYLLNPRNGYRYPIRDGIPIMLIDEGKANRVPA